MFTLIVWMHDLRSRLRDESGQATAEYALVLIAAATIAVALITWASTTGTLRTFFDAVMRRVRAYV
jgi:Flp pilus assembly pilin Flp